MKENMINKDFTNGKIVIKYFLWKYKLYFTEIKYFFRNLIATGCNYFDALSHKICICQIYLAIIYIILNI